jgi:hypothetical protein
MAHIQFNGKQKRIGWFKTPEEAALAYDSTAKELFGEFAKLNFIYMPLSVLTCHHNAKR